MDETEAILSPPPERKPRELKGKPGAWVPKLGPIGLNVLRDRKSRYKLLYGERGSLKTGICLHDLVVHCYDDLLAPPKSGPWVTPLALICTIMRSSATEGGAWEKLVNLTLPEWRDAIGLDFTEPKQDDQKNRYIFISNKYGGWSRVVLRSIPHGTNIRQRLKGMEPSYFFFDEITEATHPDYFFIPTQQLRRPTGAPRQYVAACNPSDDGEESWVWQIMVKNAVKLAGHDDGKPQLPKRGGKLKRLHKDYGVYHVPLAENVFWSNEEKENYKRTILAEAAHDPTAEDRLIKGLWVARPTGEGLFAMYFIKEAHTRGDAVRQVGLLPVPGFPLIAGYDLGQVYSSITLEQFIPTKSGKTMLLVIDDIDHLGEKILYKTLAHEVIDRIKYWRTRAGYPFKVIHITDDSAVNQWRPGSGSYDAQDFERAYNSLGEDKARLIGAPKGAGSVAARVRLLQAKLYNDEVIVSATCGNTLQMIRKLDSQPKDPDLPRRCRWLHKFDSLTYPSHWYEFSGKFVVGSIAGGGRAPRLTPCG